ncbi:MAG TPA: hypothetical protein VKV38_08395 [Trebonia sp.]|nr:hypothetical protein [Trebonia sp.]
MLLPPGWARIPLDGRESARAATLAANKTADLAEPQRSAARDKLARMIRSTLQDARSAGGIDVLLSLAERDGIPLAASCLISYLDQGQEVPLDMLAAGLSGKDDGDGGDVSLTEAGGGPAVRRRYAEDGITKVDYFLPVPGRPTGFLVMAFGTPMQPLADALVTLFDAIALSLRWQS